MKGQLAEQLLSKVMEWDTSSAKEKIPKLRYIALFKYDGYQNFEPGMQFLESLAIWLNQFDNIEERKTAYDFVINRLLYISEVQIEHLINLLYVQKILPIIIEQTVQSGRLESNISCYHRRKIKGSREFKELKRKCLFLGMSDGARIDIFRRKHSLNNEQICLSYEISKNKLERLEADLGKWLKKNEFFKSEAIFENIFLIDDFTGSGDTILNFKDGEFKGKLKRFIYDVFIDNMLKNYFSEKSKIFVVTYIASKQAIKNLKQRAIDFIKKINKDHNKSLSCTVLDPLQILDSNNSKQNYALDTLLKKYYDDRLEDEHTKKGNKNVIYGYSGCDLPLVLSHNCPNNSIYLLWGRTDKSEDRPGFQGLFPRISRHWEER